MAPEVRSRIRLRRAPGDEQRYVHVLTLGCYVGVSKSGEAGDEPPAAKIDRLAQELLSHFNESARLARVVSSLLERIDA